MLQIPLIPESDVNVKVLVPAVAAALNTIVVPSVIEEIVVPADMPVPETSIPTDSFEESITVNVAVSLAVQDCSVETLITQSAPSSPDNREERKTVFPSWVSF